MRRIRLYLAAHRRLVLRLRADLARTSRDFSEERDLSRRLATRCRTLTTRADQLTDRLEHAQAVAEAMDAPIGLDITAEEWRTAVTALAAELAARQRKGQAAA